MNKKRVRNKNNNEKLNNSIEHYNNLNPIYLPYPDDYMNIINDSDSEHVSQYEENKIKTNRLKNSINDNNVSYKTDFKTKNEQKQNYKKELLNKYNNKETNENIVIELNEADSNKENIEKLPKHYLFSQIKNEIFPKMNLKEEIIKSFILDDNLRNLEKNMSEETYYSKKTRKRGILKTEGGKNKKKGRKKNDEVSEGKHNRDSQDNIIKKIKVKILDYLLKFINNLLNSILKNKLNIYLEKEKYEKDLDKEKIIKKIDYKKIVDDMKRENNLNFLKISLKELLSYDISPKYSTLSKEINKSIIEEILNNEKDNEIIKFIFNLTFRDWFDIFTYKNEIINNCILDNKKAKIIIDNLERADKLLEEIYPLNNENNYFSCFISLLYNYERWFFIKQGRQRKEKDIQKGD